MTYPVGPLNDRQREELVNRIGALLAGVAPTGWTQLLSEYRSVGKHVEVDVTVFGADGSPVPMRPPAEVVSLLGQLRTGMYEPGRGTWLSAMLTVDPPGTTHADFVHHAQPRWRRTPPPLGFQDELRMHPRDDAHLPAWLRQRAELGSTIGPEQRGRPSTVPLAQAPAAGTGEFGELRLSKVFDGLGGDGRPVVNRPPLDPAEKDRVLDYLGGAPVVLAARSYDTDAFDRGRPPSVPLTFRTDGAWVWPGAVAYYLREHDVAPDPELLAHIRRRDYAVPDVGEDARQRAVELVTRQES
ncbi:hypothetical protein [Saccharomonospora cyanea]|uniref:Uncharacterized protein n=1 Tax=Saccharomonospora cyanea NA-134 TaxID=882082 RepID=H5XLV5_9PSEU|nr:hypothetical protein [Saccharomonospora cyanea]EHR61997.1 hypothetical protein SaccyDRAFT_3161 [Saccharomonospora cyanea NA-134]